MNEELGWFEWAFKGLVGIIGGLGWWLWNNLVKDVKAMQDKVTATDKALSNHELYSEKSFASKVEVQSSLVRVYDKLDEMGNDIKTLIRGNHN